MLTNIDKLLKQLKDIERELETLRVFRLTPQLKKFHRALIGEQSFIKSELKKLTETRSKKSTLTKRTKLANKNRSEKMKRTWRYIRSIKENYRVDLSLRELRTALKRHRQGLETDIPDVAWRNPSP